MIWMKAMNTNLNIEMTSQFYQQVLIQILEFVCLISDLYNYQNNLIYHQKQFPLPSLPPFSTFGFHSLSELQQTANAFPPVFSFPWYHHHHELIIPSFLLSFVHSNSQLFLPYFMSIRFIFFFNILESIQTHQTLETLRYS